MRKKFWPVQFCDLGGRRATHFCRTHFLLALFFLFFHGKEKKNSCKKTVGKQICPSTRTHQVCPTETPFVRLSESMPVGLRFFGHQPFFHCIFPIYFFWNSNESFLEIRLRKRFVCPFQQMVGPQTGIIFESCNDRCLFWFWSMFLLLKTCQRDFDTFFFKFNLTWRLKYLEIWSWSKKSVKFIDFFKVVSTSKFFRKLIFFYRNFIVLEKVHGQNNFW